MTRFVILAAPRTGSNLLCSLLDSHPDILCHHELFNHDGIFPSRAMRGHDDTFFGTVAERDADPDRFLTRVWQAAEEDGVSCVGWKWTRGENETALQRMLHDANVRKIVLYRRNRVKTFVSERIAQVTQQWEVYDSQELIAAPRVRVDAQDLQRHIHINERFYAELEASLQATHQPVFSVLYESLFDIEVQQQLLQFLQVRDTTHPLVAASVKQNADDLRDSVVNFEELSEELASTALAAELADRSS